MTEWWGDDAPKRLATMMEESWSVCTRCGGVPWFARSHPCGASKMTDDERKVLALATAELLRPGVLANG